MHMADALLSPAVGVAMCAVSAGAMAYSSVKIKKDELSERKLPVMAVAGAFVFAAQMINFAIPGTGSSGHIGGGILLAALLGGFPAFLTVAAVFAIQALFFADGGLLALGCNIFNLGVLPCLIVYPLIFKPLTKKGITVKNLSLASIASVIVGLQLGAFSVVLETLLSGITELPFSVFLVMMQPIHLAIGIAEGIITAAVLAFVYKLRPEILESTSERREMGKTVSVKKAVIALAIITLVVGGGLSLFASTYPDGLEWSMEKVAGTAELEAAGGIYDGAAAAQDAAAFMPDYAFKSDAENAAGTSVAGIIGSIVTFAIAGAIGIIIAWVKKKRKATV
ncbi:MAG TPA: energy-coupling factor ABC transporter permease [Clostridia bacterium]|nr:energy-coupling factor ABC transporter permease [Clostridia bacterium]